MPYLYATERPDYSDLASGRVFYSLPGHPAFPVRLADEIFQRCGAIRRADGLTGACRLYDPCCGSGYLVAVLGCLHAAELSAVTASDVDERAVECARRNLVLLTPPGLARRAAELEDLLNRFGKDSHREALARAQRLAGRLAGSPPAFHTFTANALAGIDLPPGSVDLVISDVPYGQHSQWSGAQAGVNPLQTLLAALRGCLAPGGLVALASDKGQKVPRDGWRRRDHFQLGLRRIEILQPLTD
jgi:methylase of polypeptide subunit release factors